MPTAIDAACEAMGTARNAAASRPVVSSPDINIAINRGHRAGPHDPSGA
jgi:hypothetical protein